MDRGFVHHLDAARHNALGDDLRHTIAAVFERGEAHEYGARGLGLAQQAHGHFGNDAQ
jgi:hypothetical protein